MRLLKIFCSLALLATVIVLAGCLNSKMEPPYEGPNFIVQQDVAATGDVTYFIQATLFNGTSIYKEIKEGSMTMNGQPMKLGYTALNAPYFFIDSPGVTLNTTYTFEIPLKDGRVGSGVITTQDAQLNLLAPASASTQNNLPISWSTSNHDDMSVTLFFKTNGASNEVQGPTYEPTPAQIAAGAFTIPSVAFERPGLVHVRIVLRGVKLGTTSNFHTGADASSVMTSEKIVEFK